MRFMGWGWRDLWMCDPRYLDVLPEMMDAHYKAGLH